MSDEDDLTSDVCVCVTVTVCVVHWLVSCVANVT